jgi:uncharacterized protein (UPF0335 family)
MRMPAGQIKDLLEKVKRLEKEMRQCKVWHPI